MGHIFCAGNGGLYIIDQHAAGTFKYEYYRDKIGDVDASPNNCSCHICLSFLEQILSSFKKNGAFKSSWHQSRTIWNNTFILREHPIWMKEEEIESAVYEM